MVDCNCWCVVHAEGACPAPPAYFCRFRRLLLTFGSDAQARSSRSNCRRQAWHTRLTKHHLADFSHLQSIFGTYASWPTLIMVKLRTCGCAASGPAFTHRNSLTDCLISANGIIPQKLAGKVRYMDSTYVLLGLRFESAAKLGQGR